MRAAILSDIHGNLAAFEAVLADMDALGIREAVNLGDIVGYGPQPEECVNLLRERAIPSVMGNHELGLAQQQHLCTFNPHAREALCLTLGLLSGNALAYLSALPAALSFHGARCVHGMPLANIRAYLFKPSLAQLARVFAHLPERLCFVGHTHDLLLATWDGHAATREEWGASGPVTLDPALAYIVNVGSVGQPRDGHDNRAKYVLWDTTARTVEVRRVAYDIDATARRMTALGFDKRLIDRLY